jgi:bile acid:Na+ symporter, BASS family
MTTTFLDRFNHTVHQYFLLILLLLYGLGAYCPGWGQSLRLVQLAHVGWWDGSSVAITLPVLLLSVLLFNAGIGVQPAQLKAIIAKPLSLLLGLCGNLMTPMVFGLLVYTFSQQWHSASEIQNILMGLAIVASMPIAGSSTAWSQNSNGNLALSLGLVVFSTVLSPLITPVILHGFGFITMGDYSEDLHTLANTGTSAFLGLCVVIPSLLGIGARLLLSNSVAQQARPYLKLLNSVCLLTLIYSNAAVVLPQTFQHPDWDFLLLIMLITGLLCLSSFGLGWLISTLIKAPPADKTALLFGLGMNNNGTGLVLSSLALADHPAVMLPIIFYNLVQHIIAGIVDKCLNTNKQ